MYILTNKNNSVLYTGVTSNLIKRCWLHKQGRGSSFTSKYKVTKLVYFEEFKQIVEAIAREKQIKAGSRKKKLELIARDNSGFEDLFEKIVE